MTEPAPRFVDWLTTELARRGARHAYGVPGGGISLDLLESAKAAGIQPVITAREDAAAIMAGVAGRLSHAPGLAFSTKGPGLASATNGLASALLDRMPTLFCAEAFDQDELAYLSHQVFDQAALGQSLFAGVADGKAAVLTPDTTAATAALDAMMTAPMGPALLLADPKDFVSPGAAPAAAPKTRPGPTTDLAALDRAAELIASAKRPVIVAGLEATTPGAAPALVALTEALGAPALVTYMAKGVIPDTHPNFAGIFTGGAIEQACVGEADLIVLAGLDPVELIRKPWPYTAAVIDICAFAHDPHYLTPAARVTGDIPTTLQALADVVKPTDWTPVEIAAHRARFLAGMTIPPGEGLAADVVAEAAVAAFAAAGAKPRLTVDAGAHMFSACAFWQAETALDVLISNGLASMGFALPAAIAAALHDPDRGAVAMTGDGGLLMCLGELKTAAETGANICVIVFNDARLSLIDIKREQRQMPDLGLAWKTPDFADVAHGFGFCVWRASTQDEMRRAAQEAAATAGPRLIDARVDPSGYLAQLKALRG